MSIELLSELNAFRAAENKSPFKDWRKARHFPMLEAYRFERDLAKGLGPEDLQPLLPALIEDAKAVGIEFPFEMTEDELAGQVGRESADIARDEAFLVAKAEEEKVEKTGEVPYKLMPVLKSTVDNPLKVVHTFLDEHPNLKRKDAVSLLVEMGVNFYTARTQYQRWFTKRKEG